MDSKAKNIVDFGAARKNLRQKAKQEARDKKEAQAAENRVRFGRTGTQKKQDKLNAARQQRHHEDHKKYTAQTPATDKADK